MSGSKYGRVTIHGETFFALTTIAECYSIDVAWVRQVYDYGLLGRGEQVDDDVCVPAEMLDRVAVIRRLQVQAGVNLEGIAILLEKRGP